MAESIIDPIPSGNFQYQFAVLHYIGHENIHERQECEEFVIELRTRVESKHTTSVSIFTDWESKIGQDIFDVVTDISDSSKYMIVVLSPSFITDPLHLHKLKSIFKTLLGQRRLIPLTIQGVHPESYSQLNFLNVITILKFAKNWRANESDSKWEKLLRTVCTDPIITDQGIPATVYQSARGTFGLNAGLGLITDTDGMAGTTSRNNVRKEKYFKVLQDHCTLITDNIEVEDFSSYLIQERVFTIDQLQEVTCERTRLKRAREFVQKLKTKSADQIAAAIRSMTRTYSHVANPILAVFRNIDAELEHEDGHVTGYMEEECRNVVPVQDTSVRGDNQRVGPPEGKTPTAPSVQPHSLPPQSRSPPSGSAPTSYNPSIPQHHLDYPDTVAAPGQETQASTGRQPQANTQPRNEPLPLAMDPRSIEIINAEIARLEVMKAQMMTMQGAHSSSSIPSHVSPAHSSGRAAHHAQPPASLPPPGPATAWHAIPQDLLPFSPTDENGYQHQIIAHPSSQVSSAPGSHPGAGSYHTQQGSLPGQRQPAFAYPPDSQGPPTNPNPVQPAEASITQGVRDLSLRDQPRPASHTAPGQHLSSVNLALSETGGDVR